MTPSSLPLRARVAALVVVAAMSVAARAQGRPPVAPIRDVTDTYFGVAVPDPYRYLEDTKNAEVAAWMKAQADYTRNALDRIRGRAPLLRRIAELGDAVPARVATVQISNGQYYYLKRLANQDVPKLYVRAGLAGKERLLVDPENVKAAAG